MKRPARSRKMILTDLKKLNSDMSALHKEFQTINKKAMDLIKKAHLGSDQTKLESIRKKLGL